MQFSREKLDHNIIAVSEAQLQGTVSNKKVPCAILLVALKFEVTQPKAGVKTNRGVFT